MISPLALLCSEKKLIPEQKIVVSVWNFQSLTMHKQLSKE